MDCWEQHLEEVICMRAGIAVLDVIESEKLMDNVNDVYAY